jgi:ribonuclease P protein component
MISKSHRFHGHNSLNPVYKYGQAFNVSQISIKSVASRSGKPYRLAVVVSKKVNKSAVVRNRIRRRIYENLRPKLLNLVQDNDIVINVYNEQAGTLAAGELDNILSDLLTKAGLLTSVEEKNHDIVDTNKREN